MNRQGFFTATRNLCPSLAISLAMALAFSLSLSACKVTTTKLRPGSESAKETDKEKNELELSIDPTDALVNEGEALLAPATMDQALAKFNEAQTIDPKNPRAKFWIAMVKPVLAIKGIVQRVRPAFASVPEGEQRYRDFVRSIREKNSPEVQRFLTDGPEDIKSSDEMQAWLDRLNASFYETRNVLRELRDQDITVHVPRKFLEGSFFYSSLTYEACGEISFGPVRYATSDDSCDPSKPLPVGLARPDFEALLYGLSIYQIYFEFWTAYRIDANSVIKASNRKITSREQAEGFVRDLLSAGTGKKRHAHPFSGLKEMAADSISGLQYILSNQDKVCGDRVYSPTNRKGYLVSFGICVQLGREETSEEKSLQLLENFLAGKSFELKGPRRQWNEEPAVVAEINPMSLIERPIEDLHDFLPMTFRECGEVETASDRAVRHAFTKGRLQDFIDAHAGKCLPGTPLQPTNLIPQPYLPVGGGI